MKPAVFDVAVEELLSKIRTTLVEKNTEYSRSNDDRLANFKRRADSLGLTALDVMLVDLHKHNDAIVSFVQRFRNGTPAKLNDPIERRALDSAIYNILLICLVRDLGAEGELTSTGLEEHKQEKIKKPECVMTNGCIRDDCETHCNLKVFRSADAKSR